MGRSRHPRVNPDAILYTMSEMRNGKRLEDKTMVVTGGALGIGKACCLRAAEQGASVAVTDIRDEDGSAVAEEIVRNGGKARYWHLDTTNSGEIGAVFDQIADAPLGGIDILVNNAGISGADKPTDRIEESEWEEVIDVNVKGVFLCTKKVIPFLRKRGGGSIINLSSIYGLVGAADLPPYHASKGAVRLMSKNDALFYAQEGIRVNSVHPGFIWTPLVEELARKSEPGVEGFRRELDSRHPVGHVGEPDDIAYGVIYLASDESTFVTGSELVIDGGYTAR